MSFTAMPFKRVQRNPDVCNNCFRRTHKTYERNYAKRLRRVGTETEIWWEEVDLPPERLKVDGETSYVDSDMASEGQDPVCACGYHFGDKLRPLPKDLFMDYAGNLVDRYLELGHDFPVQAFVDYLDRVKSDPDRQFADDRLYAQATSRFVRPSPQTAKAD